MSDIEAAHDELVDRGIDVSDVWHGPPFPPEARQPGPDPERTSYGSFWLLQRSRRQYVARPGDHHAAPRPDRPPTETAFVSVEDLESGASACRDRPRRTPEAVWRTQMLSTAVEPRRELASLVCLDIVAEQAGRSLPDLTHARSPPAVAGALAGATAREDRPRALDRRSAGDRSLEEWAPVILTGPRPICLRWRRHYRHLEGHRRPSKNGQRERKNRSLTLSDKRPQCRPSCTTRPRLGRGRLADS